MIDTVKLRCDRLRLAQGAILPRTLPPGFRRSHHQGGTNGQGRLCLVFEFTGIELVRLTCFKLVDGRWVVKRVRLNIPKLVHGHNGRVLSTEIELALALARLRWILEQVVEETDWSRIVPGTGFNNSAYIEYLETTIQVNDPGGRLIRASHFAQLPFQRFPNCVYYGESTRTSLRELRVSIYDKLAQTRNGLPEPSGHSPTRLEVILRNGERLAQEYASAREIKAAPGSVLATISLDDTYLINQQVLRSMSGFRWLCSPSEFAKLSRTSRLLMLGLGDAVGDPLRVDELLERYRQSESPSDRHFRTIAGEVREFAGRIVTPEVALQLPDDRSKLETVNVVLPGLEDQFARYMDSAGAPFEPDPEIIRAWSATTFAEPALQPGGLVGSTAPSPLPFLRDTL